MLRVMVYPGSSFNHPRLGESQRRARILLLGTRERFSSLKLDLSRIVYIDLLGSLASRARVRSSPEDFHIIGQWF